MIWNKLVLLYVGNLCVQKNNFFFLILFHLRNLLMVHHQESQKKSRKQILPMKRKWYVIFETVYNYPVLEQMLEID